MLSENIYMPYFYIIKHLESGKMYAGSRWAKGCNPSEFMKLGGYTTSSKTVNAIIDKEGLDCFEVVTIKTEFDDLCAYDYETKFLIENDCAKSKDWFNKHNNEGFVFGTDEFYNSSKRTCLEKYGVEYSLQSKEIREKAVNTWIEKYGVDTPAKCPSVVAKMKTTNMERYGVELPTQLDSIKEQTKRTNIERYGYEVGLLSPEIREKSKNTCMEKYGYTHPSSVPEIKTRINETYKKTNLEKYGAEYPAIMQVICPHCSKSGARRIMMRWHFDNCKNKLD